MNDNTAFCLIFIACIGGCATCGVSNNMLKVERARIESAERLEIIKATEKLPEEP